MPNSMPRRPGDAQPARPDRRLPFVLGVARQHTHQPGLVWGRHHRAYLRHCATAAGIGEPHADRAILHAAMAACGYRNVAKFQRRRSQWNGGEGAIPLAYLAHIGCSLATLGDCVALDRSEHAGALRVLPPATTFIEQVNAAVWRTVLFPEPVAEPDTAHLIRLHQAAQPRPRRCAVRWPFLKTVYVRADGSVNSMCYVPAMAMDGTHCRISDDGSVGMASKRP